MRYILLILLFSFPSFAQTVEYVEGTKFEYILDGQDPDDPGISHISMLLCDDFEVGFVQDGLFIQQDTELSDPACNLAGVTKIDQGVFKERLYIDATDAAFGEISIWIKSGNECIEFIVPGPDCSLDLSDDTEQKRTGSLRPFDVRLTGRGISVYTPDEQSVRMYIYTLTGQKIWSDVLQTSGNVEHYIAPALDLSGGLYLFTAISGKSVITVSIYQGSS